MLFNRLIGRRLVAGVYFQGSLAVIPFTFVIAGLLRPIILYFLPQYQFIEVGLNIFVGGCLFYGAHVLVHFVLTPSLDSISLG